jgi:hypothetical protein
MKRIMIALMMVAVVAGCSKPAEAPPAEAVESPRAFVDARPAGEPVPIPKARTLSGGSEVVLQGRVMGVPSPFVGGRAVFVLGDEATIKPCTDGCATPWDACCDPLKVRATGTAAIQVLDDAGKVLARGIKGVKGLKEMSRVTVSGVVAKHSSEAAFVVNAKAVYVEPDKQ